jgi:ketosteroid isomerase-like protein
MTETQKSEQLEAAALVKRFLEAMANRDLAAAGTMIATDAKIIFPGGKAFKSQQDMVAAARGRYQWIKKKFEQIDTAVLTRARVAVYVMGTLYGCNNFGVDFAGVRYIDRFEVEGGLIVSQQVWNDLAESGVLNSKS